MNCPDGRVAVGEMPGLSPVLGYIAKDSGGRFRAERLDGTLINDSTFATQNEAARFIDSLKSNRVIL
jgi:hypothetical protein